MKLEHDMLLQAEDVGRDFSSVATTSRLGAVHLLQAAVLS